MRSVFVTVGSTVFHKLVAAAVKPEVQEALQRAGFTHMVIQHGMDGDRVLRGQLQQQSAEDYRLRIRSFDYSASIREEMAAADLIISHAGSGTILEALNLRKPLVVVVNDMLMDNHQQELADELQKSGYVASCLPSDLADAIQNMKQPLKAFATERTTALNDVLREEAGL